VRRASRNGDPRRVRASGISEWDLEILGFVARLGIGPADAVAYWAGTGRSVTYRREARWRDYGLVRVHPPIGDSNRLLVCTREGLRATGREDLSVPRISIGRVPHAVEVAWLAARREQAGQAILTEREALAIERARGEPIYSVDVGGGRRHWPDLVLREGPVAVEVELSTKSARRLDALLSAAQLAVFLGQYAEIRYLCAPHAIGAVRRAIERTSASAQISVERLGPRAAAKVVASDRCDPDFGVPNESASWSGP
jgi:hypothetical protein